MVFKFILIIIFFIVIHSQNQFLNDQDAEFIIQSRRSHYLMTVKGNSKYPGANIIQWPWHGSASQRWKIQYYTQDLAYIKSVHSNLVLQTYQLSKTKGAHYIQTLSAVGRQSQLFTIISLGNKGWKIQGFHYQYVLDVKGNSKKKGAQIILWPYHGGANQRWNIYKYFAPKLNCYKIISVLSNLVLDVYSASNQKGAQIIQWPWHGGLNQRWRFKSIGSVTSRYFYIYSQKTGMVLDIYAYNYNKGAKLIQWNINNGQNQQFKIVPVGSNQYKIVVRHSGLVLDVYADKTIKGTKIIQWPWHGGANQRWMIKRC